MDALPVLPANPGPNGVKPISPTDISQFIRLEQCERYLRLRMHERAVNPDFMRDYGVVPQAITPLLSESGASFEQTIEQDIARHCKTLNLATGVVGDGVRTDENELVVYLARTLAPGEVQVLFQPRVVVELSGWRLRGDIDILRLERDASGYLQLLIVDMKSSTSVKVEHRLQVAFYHEMLATLFGAASITFAAMELGILYRGPAEGDEGLATDEVARRARERDNAIALFGTAAGYLELTTDADSYRDAVRDLVTGDHSAANRVAQAEFDAVPFHLTYKCDGCLYNEFCMKRSAERDNLSLLPHLTLHDKRALERAGITTVHQLAALKEPGDDPNELVATPRTAPLVRKLGATWPVGPRLDELIHRARRYRRWQLDPLDALSYLPSKGYGSLPYADATHNPNLVRIYIDAQHDYLNDRIYLLGSLVVACEAGVAVPHRRRAIVHLTDGPPSTSEQEAELFVRWIGETIRAVVEVAAPDAAGAPRAPIHVIFWNSWEQRVLLDGLARHFATILGATPLYDFLTQLAAFDSPLATFLDQEIRELKNYPMVCQSLQTVAAYLRFNWNEGTPYRDIFRTRLFDFWGRLGDDGSGAWYTNRARFNSQIPLEYAHAAWGILPADGDDKDDYADYRTVTPELLRGFQARRLEALEHVVQDFRGNQQTEKTSFELPELRTFRGRARTLAQALDEFVTIERYVELGAWKAARLAPPERRVLTGDTLVVSYHEAEQLSGVAEQNREHERRMALREEYRAAYRVAHPDAKKITLPKEQRAETESSLAGARFRLRLECGGVDCNLDEILALTTLRVGDRLVLRERYAVDSRLPVDQRQVFTPTPKQLLYGMRVTLTNLLVERDTSNRATEALIEVEIAPSRGGTGARGFTFAGLPQPLIDGKRYTLDDDPNNIYASWTAKVTEALQAGGKNTLYARIADPANAVVTWPEGARAGQARFLEGLDALHSAGVLHAFEPSKRAYIGEHGASPTLLVQGPPGTGKSYGTAFAVFARIQGAMTAELSYRVFAGCKTHAATDVLLEGMVKVQRKLREWSRSQPEIFTTYFDERLLTVPLFRARGKHVIEGTVALRKEEERSADEGRNMDTILAQRWCVVGVTPGGVYGMVTEKWSKNFLDHSACDCLVLDEASQFNLPEAVMAALPLKPDGHLIVVGDHRQMPPIVHHDWSDEPRRTFQQYQAYQSLFLTLLPLEPPMIKFAESFRLHRDMAEFLRQEIYHLDGIPYYSRRQELLPARAHADAFVQSILAPEHPLVVVVHAEHDSQLRNPVEERLMASILEALLDAESYGLDPRSGIGVVVPHRAQRAAIQAAAPALAMVDPNTGAITLSAVDTVERFQGGEREVILISATESDPQYILAAGEFLLDPRRLTVALSRAKQKLVLLAARSIFNTFSADEETFQKVQLWKNLLRRTCTVLLWKGEREGVAVEVWGNQTMR